MHQLYAAFQDLPSIPVFPGIDLVYHSCPFVCMVKHRNLTGRIFAVHFCRSGRIDWEMQEDRHHFLQAGDLMLLIPDERLVGTYFTLPAYEGISIFVSLDDVKPIRPMLSSFGVDLDKLMLDMQNNKGFLIERDNELIPDIFTELDCVHEKIRSTYTQIKVLQLFLILSTLDFTSAKATLPYFRKSDVAAVNMARQYITEHCDEDITIKRLAERFSLSQTLLKSCFRSVNGVPVYAFLRSCRMKQAAKLLCESDEKITCIALSVGYSNSSKFSAAFKAEIGLLPLEYRRRYRDGRLPTGSGCEG